MTAGGVRRLGWYLLAAGVLVSPHLVFGYPIGDDMAFHLASWWEVQDNWRGGMVYPRWSDIANYGLGDPRFVFYPPGSFIIGGAFTTLLGLQYGLSLFLVACLVLAGWSMFHLASRFVNPQHAFVAGMLYLASPYHLAHISRRFALAEFLADALLPLFILQLIRVSQGERRSLPWLGLIVGTIGLINIPTAIMSVYCAAMWVVIHSVLTRSFRAAPGVIAGFALGGLVAAFHYAPLYLQLQWVQTGRLYAPALADEILPLPRLAGNMHVMLAVYFGLFCCALGLTWYRVGRPLAATERTLLAISWSTLFLASVLATPLWWYLPGLRFVQFPWRWLAPATAAGTPLIVRLFAFHPSWLVGIRWCLVLGAVLWYVLCSQLTRVTSLEQPDFATIVDQIQARQVSGPPEYKPVWAQARPRFATHRPIFVNPVDCGGIDGPEAEIESWKSHAKSVILEVPASTVKTFGVFFFPTWQVFVNGTRTDAEVSQCGAIQVNLQAGQNRVELRFQGDVPGQREGIALSTIGGLIILIMFTRHRSSI